MELQIKESGSKEMSCNVLGILSQPSASLKHDQTVFVKIPFKPNGLLPYFIKRVSRVNVIPEVMTDCDHVITSYFFHELLEYCYRKRRPYRIVDYLLLAGLV